MPAESPHDNQPLALLLPRNNFEIAETWNMTGLVATGSNPLSLDNTFVPNHHAATFQNILNATSRDDRTDDDAYYTQLLVPVICAQSTGPAVGIATAAYQYFTNLIGHRTMAYSPHKRQIDAPQTPFQLAETCALIDTADYFGTRLARSVDHHVATGEPWTVAERVQSRFDAARAVRLCRQACDIIDWARARFGHPRQRHVVDAAPVFGIVLRHDTFNAVHGC
ncbi:hypothetical protein ACFXNW_06070 [Nocardia sp. NPDC059180]|uniref:hypothetical protein n=1 Tax=Nocardia sp. NPDC059180 TaxID=3346761 RepID=UPI0036B4DE82